MFSRENAHFGVMIDLGNLDPGLANAMISVLDTSHPLEKQMPIGCHVKPTISKDELVKIMLDAGYRIHEARGIAECLLEGPNEVIGITDLTDKDRETRPYVTVMDSTGCAYPLLFDDLEVVPKNCTEETN